MTPLRRATGLAVAVLIAVVAAGCGSSDSGGSGPGAGSSTSAAVEKLQQEPTTIPLTTPLPGKPKPGGTLVFLRCAVPQCAQHSAAYAAAAKLVGWKIVEIPFKDTDAATLATAMRKALAARPDAVAFGGTPYALWSQYIPELQKAGAVVVPSFIGEAPLGDTVPTNVAGPVNDKAMAASLARWVADDSDGKAHVLVQKVGAYNAVLGWAKDFEAELGKICTGCKIEEINTEASQLLGAGSSQAIVSEIRKNPSIDYFVGYNGAFFSGLDQALKNAQLKVKVGGMFPLPQNVQDVMNGSGGAFLAVSNVYTAWASMDAALRAAQGAPPAPLDQQVFPAKLVTKASAKKTDGEFNGPDDIAEQFAKLWKVG